MSRYTNLIHWKTRQVLNQDSFCYTGDSYTDETTDLMIKIKYKENELSALKKRENNDDEIKKTIEILSNNLDNLKKNYEIKKKNLIKASSYEMFPDNTLIQCQLISKDGKNIKADNSFGNQLVWCRVVDQRCFYSEILYAVKIIKNGVTIDICHHTRASQVNWPRPSFSPNSFLKDCDKDDYASPPELGHENENIFNKEKFAAGNGVNAVKKISKYACDESVCCDVCDIKNIDPNDVGEDYNLAEIGGGYAHEGCMTEEMFKEYEDSLNDCVENPEDIQRALKKKFKESGMSDSDASFLSSGVKNMDKNNLKMAKVMAEKGTAAAVKKMFVHPTEGHQLSYSEMRSFYG